MISPESTVLLAAVFKANDEIRDFTSIHIVQKVISFLQEIQERIPVKLLVERCFWGSGGGSRYPGQAAASNPFLERGRGEMREAQDTYGAHQGREGNLDGTRARAVTDRSSRSAPAPSRR